jgi:hypothetical protein
MLVLVVLVMALMVVSAGADFDTTEAKAEVYTTYLPLVMSQINGYVQPAEEAEEIVVVVVVVVIDEPVTTEEPVVVVDPIEEPVVIIDPTEEPVCTDCGHRGDHGTSPAQGPADEIPAGCGNGAENRPEHAPEPNPTPEQPGQKEPGNSNK